MSDLLQTILGVAGILLVIGVALWSSRTKESKGGIDNQESVRRYGRGL